jgi:hypothetical protein
VSLAAVSDQGNAAICLPLSITTGVVILPLSLGKYIEKYGTNEEPQTSGG